MTAKDEFPDIRDLYKIHSGKKVKLRGRSHKIKYSSQEAVYPYKHTAIYVGLDPVNKKTKYYRDMRNKLGDDWETDGLRLEGAEYANVFNQLIDMGR